MHHECVSLLPFVVVVVVYLLFEVTLTHTNMLHVFEDLRTVIKGLPFTCPLALHSFTSFLA